MDLLYLAAVLCGVPVLAFLALFAVEWVLTWYERTWLD